MYFAGVWLLAMTLIHVCLLVLAHTKIRAAVIADVSVYMNAVFLYFVYPVVIYMLASLISLYSGVT